MLITQPSYIGITNETYIGAERREPGAVTLKGDWHTNRQYVELKKGSGQIVLPFTGGEVNLVMEPGSSGNAAVTVLVDGKHLSRTLIVAPEPNWARTARSLSTHIAIVGLGNIGSRVATNLTAGAVNVIVSDRDLEKARDLAEKLGPKAVAMTIDAALKKADIVILSILFDVMKKFVVEHRADLAGKIVVDPSNPIAPDGKGFKKIIPADQSAGKIIADLLPEGAELVKAFGTLSARSLGAAANRKPEPAVLFYATDFPKAGKAVAKLISAGGFAPVSVGGIDQAVRIEAFGDLNESGKLGRLVSRGEAEALV